MGILKITVLLQGMHGFL